jgi:hypothetical protein
VLAFPGTGAAEGPLKQEEFSDFSRGDISTEMRAVHLGGRDRSVGNSDCLVAGRWGYVPSTTNVILSSLQCSDRLWDPSSFLSSVSLGIKAART